MNEEYDFLKKLNVKWIVSDISPIGTLGEYKLQLYMGLINNFT